MAVTGDLVCGPAGWQRVRWLREGRRPGYPVASARALLFHRRGGRAAFRGVGACVAKYLFRDAVAAMRVQLDHLDYRVSIAVELDHLDYRVSSTVELDLLKDREMHICLQDFQTPLFRDLLNKYFK